MLQRGLPWGLHFNQASKAHRVFHWLPRLLYPREFMGGKKGDMQSMAGLYKLNPVDP
jgi:hypothetical protein